MGAMRGPSVGTQVVAHLFLVCVTMLTLYPILWVVNMALTPGQAFAVGWLPIPTSVSLENFEYVLTATDAQGTCIFINRLCNSIIVSTSTALIGLIASTTAAYAMSRWSFPGKEAGMQLFLTTQMFPSVVMAVPLYLMLDNLHLLDSLTGLVVVYSTTSVPFSVWTLKGYFDTIPREIEEAAWMDGASRWLTFWRIVLPLARPALAVTGLFSFMTAWNEFILAATITSDPNKFTLPVMLQRYVDDYGAEWGHFAAGSILVSLPVVLLFFALQKHFVGGLTAGGVKG